MTQIFISYKSENRDFAASLRDKLHTWNYATWFDGDDIPQGMYFRHEIDRGLKNSTVVIGIMTPTVVYPQFYGVTTAHAARLTGRA